MKKKRFLKRFGWSILIAFIVMNAMAFFHAYKFTHFDPDEQVKTSEPKQLSFFQKLGVLFFGVDLPRPQAGMQPNASFESVRIKSNKEIDCWLIRVDEPRGTVLLFHGYGGEKSSMLDKAEVFQSLGYNTFLIDFMGAGGSEGNQTTIGYFEAEQVKSSIDFIRGTGEQNVILFGTSMGAAAIMKAVADHQPPVQKVIIECPFGTMLQTVKNRFDNAGVPSFPMAQLLIFWGGVQNGFDAFDHNPRDYASLIKIPTLLFYGDKDLKVTKQETADIYKNLAGRKRLVTFPDAGHENYLSRYRTEWTREIARFLQN